MSSVPCYTLITEKEFMDAVADGETCKELAPDKITIMDEDDFHQYADHVSSIECHEDESGRVEAAEEIACYLGNFVQVDDHGVIELPVDAKLKFATEKLSTVKNLVKNMTPERFSGIGEYELRKAIRNIDIFAYPIDRTGISMPVSSYLQTMDAFMYNLSKLDKPLRLVVIQTMWLHQ